VIETACLGKYRKGVVCSVLTDLAAKTDLRGCDVVGCNIICVQTYCICAPNAVVTMSLDVDTA
jgi:hypothetical protein